MSSHIWSRENAPLLVGALALSFATANLVSLVGPFLPGELESLGQSPATIGVAFAVYPIALFVFSPPAGWLCSKIGQAPVLYAGVLLEGVLSIPSAYFATLAPTDALRVALYIFLRTLQGVGGAMSYTSICARLGDRFPDNLGEVMGLQEAVAGLGYTLGPVAGALLYNWGGFPLPFLVMGGLLLASMVVLPWAMADGEEASGEYPGARYSVAGTPPRGSVGGSMRSQNNFGGEEADINNIADVAAAHLDLDDAMNDQSPLEEGLLALAQPRGHGAGTRAFAAALRCASVLEGGGVTVASGAAIGFLVPSLQGHMKAALQLDTVGVGFMFALIASMYITASAVSGWAGDRFGYRGVMVAGLLTLTVSYLLVGPAPWLTSVFPHKLWFAWTSQLLALSGIGMGAGLALVPAMPFMLQGLRQEGVPNSSEICAALYASAYSLGEGLGPLLGGGLSQAIGFDWATVAISCCLLSLVFVLSVDAITRRPQLE
mmetsp:Transcript_17927/g.34267  ORF Transcript_17927/g.34267 Transcript_17927/m.34267 type:complete len:488 (-) Transcript_17927:749-2212(-)|eukprot:CAMPEP_0114235082 /NCGR_PEP_ID=MMETSP0058-20121206/6052_1 /TAXON_ID=36894 /ORGANISM="Pyramimonas parkeae, CCMP726" /LENGTH=487 /DNA_ID=CAMNT_0001346803 /DNA_START=766 /DNA_END=2229 /DNA_ORIENTATION=-